MGFLPCLGGAYSRMTYADLFGQIGTQYGVGDGLTTFNVPDTSRRSLVGAGGAATAALGNQPGSRGGSEQAQLTVAQMPSHAHTGRINNAGSHSHGMTSSAASQTVIATVAHSAYFGSSSSVASPPGARSTGAAGTHSHGVTIDPMGSGLPVSRLQPSMVANVLIKF